MDQLHTSSGMGGCRVGAPTPYRAYLTTTLHVDLLQRRTFLSATDRGRALQQFALDAEEIAKCEPWATDEFKLLAAAARLDEIQIAEVPALYAAPPPEPSTTGGNDEELNSLLDDMIIDRLGAVSSESDTSQRLRSRPLAFVRPRRSVLGHTGQRRQLATKR